jgi:hypothetical protein
MAHQSPSNGQQLMSHAKCSNLASAHPADRYHLILLNLLTKIHTSIMSNNGTPAPLLRRDTEATPIAPDVCVSYACPVFLAFPPFSAM